MAEAPCIPAAPRHFRLPRHGRRKVHVVRLGGGGGGCGGGSRGHQARGGRGLRLRRWLSRAVWRLAELCVAALSGGHPSVPTSQPPWTGIEPCFAAPFVPVATMVKRAKAQD